MAWLSLTPMGDRFPECDSPEDFRSSLLLFGYISGGLERHRRCPRWLQSPEVSWGATGVVAGVGWGWLVLLRAGATRMCCYISRWNWLVFHPGLSYWVSSPTSPLVPPLLPQAKVSCFSSAAVAAAASISFILGFRFCFGLTLASAAFSFGFRSWLFQP